MRLMAMSLFTRHLPGMSLSPPSKREVMTTLGEALGAGTLTPVIDRTYPLDQAALALRHLQDGRARGRILVAP